MRSYFEEVRSLGNKAAHEGEDDRELALRSLFAVHQIAVWFHETMDIEPDQMLTLESTETGDRHTLYLWTTPLKAAPPKPK